MAVVNTNISASIAQSALVKNQRALSSAMEELSTGRKINSAADDAAGLAISTRMSSQIKGLDMAVQNANDAVGMVNTAEGALVEIANMLQRMRELALQSSNGTTDVNDRSYLNKEYQALYAEIDRIVDNTEWNGRTILDNTADGSSSGFVEFQVGVDTGQTITVDFGDFRNGKVYGTSAAALAAGVTTSAKGLSAFRTATFAEFNNSANIVIDSATFGYNGTARTISATTTTAAQTTASAAITAIDTALDAISNQRATFGATANRLTHSIDNLTNIRINAEATKSAIMDTDYAESTSQLAKTQIIAQAGTAMLAQANQLPQTVLALLQ